MNGRTEDDEFHQYRKEAIKRATELCEGKKSKAYSRGAVSIRDYWRYHGLKGLAFEIYKRSLRFISMTRDGADEANFPESFEDCALDIINYGSFLYAEAKCRKQESGVIF